MDKEKVITKITDVGVVAVVRAESSDQAIRIADACIEGGIPAIELTFTVPRANKVIEDLAAKYSHGEIILGAGTVMDPETARIAILAGAEYVVSPYFNAETVRTCNRYRVPCMPGAMTIKEVVEAMEAGADIVKIFPGDLFGPKIIKDIKGPIPYAKMMPTGGVDIDNVHEWINAGAVAVGTGSSLTKGAKTGDYAAVTATAKQFVAKVKEAREAKK
ncbi:MAG: bifunctional 2-keto-4-hydroxyglutarate aldolase/2-keto-3-deoxy-6-phosphogluconate aldolase [Clostridia bacterium]|nr:bifunctional 2-keto-4-hydroxyglutarate aldolase/2-keto-3-deoxy-6-phosphogluconate aldolase [Clostridia bacterium]